MGWREKAAKRREVSRGKQRTAFQQAEQQQRTTEDTHFVIHPSDYETNGKMKRQEVVVRNHTEEPKQTTHGGTLTQATARRHGIDVRRAAK